MGGIDDRLGMMMGDLVIARLRTLSIVHTVEVNRTRRWKRRLHDVDTIDPI